MTWTIRQRSKQGDLAAIVSGDGPPMVLIHGVGLRSEAWGRQIDGLSSDHKIFAVDMPGHGASPMPDKAMALRDYVDAIAATLEAPAVVVGHSMGAMIALDMACRYPQLVRGVAALNAVYRRDVTAQAAVLSRAASLDGQSMADPSATLERWFGAEASSAREACRGWLCSADPKGYQMAYRVFAEHNGPSEAQLARLSCPALFVTGSEEPNSTPAMSQAMAAAVPQGQVQVIDCAAHMMPMTHSDEVTTALRWFARKALR